MDPLERVWAFKFAILAHNFRPIQNPSYARKRQIDDHRPVHKARIFFAKFFKNVTKTGPKSGSRERLYHFLIQLKEGIFSRPPKSTGQKIERISMCPPPNILSTKSDYFPNSERTDERTDRFCFATTNVQSAPRKISIVFRSCPPEFSEIKLHGRAFHQVEPMNWTIAENMLWTSWRLKTI